MKILSLLAQADTVNLSETVSPTVSDEVVYQSTEAATAATDAAGVLAALLLFVLVVLLVSYVFTGITLSRIFKKAGQSGSAAWIPIYNNWKMIELGGQKGFWAVLTLVPVINIVALVYTYIAMHRIGLRFGKSDAFVLLAILFTPAWALILAFDKSTWQGDSTNANPQAMAPNSGSVPFVPPTDASPAVDTAPEMQPPSSQPSQNQSDIASPLPSSPQSPSEPQAPQATPYVEAPIQPDSTDPLQPSQTPDSFAQQAQPMDNTQLAAPDEAQAPVSEPTSESTQPQNPISENMAQANPPAHDQQQPRA